MSNYRLRIEELGNGNKKYYIQKAVLVTTRGWIIQRQRIVWKDYTGDFSCEETVMSALANIKAMDAEMEGKQVVKTTYKDV
jgi:hypothetical protein